MLRCQCLSVCDGSASRRCMPERGEGSSRAIATALGPLVSISRIVYLVLFVENKFFFFSFCPDGVAPTSGFVDDVDTVWLMDQNCFRRSLPCGGTFFLIGACLIAKQTACNVHNSTVELRRVGVWRCESAISLLQDAT